MHVCHACMYAYTFIIHTCQPACMSIHTHTHIYTCIDIQDVLHHPYTHHSCMYVCVCVYIYIYIYIYIYMYRYTGCATSPYLIHAYTHIHTHRKLYINLQKLFHTFIDMHTYKYTYTHTGHCISNSRNYFIHSQTCIHTNIHTYAQGIVYQTLETILYIHRHAYIQIYIHTHRALYIKLQNLFHTFIDIHTYIHTYIQDVVYRALETISYLASHSQENRDILFAHPGMCVYVYMDYV